MSEATVEAGSAAPEPVSKRRRIVQIVSWIVGLVLLLVVLNLLGVNVRDWLSELWDSVECRSRLATSSSAASSSACRPS